MSKLDISVLGTPRIEVDGAPLQVDTRKATALLTYLATTARPQSRDRLVGLLWPDYDEEKARGALRRTLSTLKKALGDRWVSADRSTVTLDLADVGFDLGTLRGALELVASHGHDPETDCAECLTALTRAAEVAGGEFLQGFSLRDAEPFDEWRSLEAYSVTRELTRVLDMLVHSHTSAGNLGAAVDAARRKLDLDPLDEPTHRQLMQLNAWRGMRGAALEQYRECVAVLDRELGVPPLPETTALYDAIAEGEVETRETPRLKEPGARRPARAPAGYPLRGRTAEMDGLLELYSRLGDGGALVSIQGEAGIGKTRLAEEFLDAVTERGAPSLSARGHEGESGLPYALITQLLERVADRLPSSVPQGALTEASRLLPSLSPDAVPGPIDDPGATGRFFEGIREVLTASLAGSQPGVLFADDLQWCDSASLEVLTYLARRLDETPILLLPSWRTEEIDRSHPLNHLVAAAERNSSVQLERLKEEDVRALVDDATENTGAEVGDLAHRLMVETEGIPFFIVEYLAVAGEGEGDWRLPQSIKELLRSRAELVDETSRQILGTAAVIDRSFDFDTVWKASGRTEFETVDALEELVGHRLVVPAEPTASTGATYEFSHEKLRTYIYGEMSPARRRVLHRRVGEALLTDGAPADRATSVSALAARHLELGGLEKEAALQHERAATYARTISANTAALDHYLAALALDHPNRSVLHEGAGDMHVLLGDYQAAIGDYQTAAATADPDSIASLEHKLGEVHLRRGDWEQSRSHLVMALELVEEGDGEHLRAKILAALSFNAYRNGAVDDAVDLGVRSLEAATRSDDPQALAHARNQLGILENARGRYDEAAIHLEESLRVAAELDDAAVRSAALNNLAQTARLRGEIDRALDLTREALEICIRQGDSHHEAAIRNNLADLLHGKGDSDGAMEQLKTAAAVLARIGDEPTGMLPEVWKLVEW